MNKTSLSSINNNTLPIFSRKNSFLIIGLMIISCAATFILFSDKIIARAAVLSSEQANSISVLPLEPTRKEVLTWWCKSWKISKETCNLLSTK